MMLTKEKIAEFLNVFGSNLRTHRINLRLSYDKAAKLSGVSKSILSRIENGQTAPSFDTFLRLYVFFNVTTDFLISHNNENEVASQLTGNALISGSKFKKVNFLGRPTISAEIENVSPDTKVNLQARRSQEETILIISGECTISYGDADKTELKSGEMYTIPPSRREYAIATLHGTQILRISTPLSADKSGGTRYRAVLRKPAKS